MPYLNITENCGDTASRECWNDDSIIYYLNGDIHLRIEESEYYKLKLSDGVLLAFQRQPGHAHFYIDTNGKGRSNAYGKDIFLLTLIKGSFIEKNIHDISHPGLWVYGTSLSDELYKSDCKVSCRGMFCGVICLQITGKYQRIIPDINRVF